MNYTWGLKIIFFQTTASSVDHFSRKREKLSRSGFFKRIISLRKLRYQGIQSQTDFFKNAFAFWLPYLGTFCLSQKTSQKEHDVKKAVQDLESQKARKPVSESWRHWYEERSSKAGEPSQKTWRRGSSSRSREPESQRAGEPIMKTLIWRK